MIYERRKDDQRRQVFADVLKASDESRRRAAFEANGDARIRTKRIEARTQEILGAQQSALESRRKKLGALLKAEEEQYAAEVAGAQETTIERMARMRQKVKTLREDRETERLDFSQRMQDVAWRANCDELRTATSRQEHMKVDEDRRAQRAEKAEMDRRLAEVDKMYADMWENDRLVKEAREAEQAEASAIANHEVSTILLAQMEEIEKNRQADRELKAEQQTLRLEEARLMKEEDERRRGDKHRAQARFRRILDRDAAERAAFAESTMDDEMSADLDLLDEIKAEQKASFEAAMAHKRQLAKEAEAYHTYLRDMQQQRAQAEKEFEAACLQDMRRAHAKQNAEWRAQRDKRRAMMTDVIATRREQIRLRQEQIAQERADIAAEGDRIQADLDAFKTEQAVESEKLQEFHQTYGRDLHDQIEDNSRRRLAERQAEIDFETKLSATHRATDDRVTRELASLLTISGKGI